MIRAVLFDWGGTVMCNLPYAGPMAEWPEVEAVPGIAEALADLHPRYRLALATNAAESDAFQVRAALRRAGLEGRFDAVFTARQLGARKPQPAFFQAALRELGCTPGEVVMVGDDYMTDVSGAKEMGLRAVWYNPVGLLCPAVHPVQDAEVRDMAGLPAVLHGLNLPDVAECLALLAGQEVSPALQQHVEAVAVLAYRLAARLRRCGEEVDPLLTHRGALLHDLDKVTSRRTNQAHGQVGAQLLREKGQAALADIVERHLIYTIMDPARHPATWEEKLVYYVDKIVEGDRIVSVPERLEALCGRYPENAARMRSCLPFILDLETEICARLGSSPAELFGPSHAAATC